MRESEVAKARRVRVKREADAQPKLFNSIYSSVQLQPPRKGILKGVDKL